MNPYNSIMTVVTIACWVLAKFTFSTIGFCSILRIGPYLFYKKKFITQFKTTEKNDRSCHSFTSIARTSCKEKAAFFNACPLITREIMRSRIRHGKAFHGREGACCHGDICEMFKMLRVRDIGKNLISRRDSNP